MSEEKAIVEQPNSCKIAINAKGQWSGEVKVYAANIDDAVGTAVHKANGLAALIKQKNG